MKNIEYFYNQFVKYKSFEHENIHWTNGQNRYIALNFNDIDRNKNILDIACGDGVGLRFFKEMGFNNVTGFEYCDEKYAIAKQTGYPVFAGDFHNLDVFQDNSFDIVYSSHSLEHALDPNLVLLEFNRILKPGGSLFLVLPFVDYGADDAHCAKYELGTNVDDQGERLISYITSRGFNLISKSFDNFREPEIWTIFVKNEN